MDTFVHVRHGFAHRAKPSALSLDLAFLHARPRSASFMQGSSDEIFMKTLVLWTMMPDCDAGVM
jgi:hypothetical protein